MKPKFITVSDIQNSLDIASETPISVPSTFQIKTVNTTRPSIVESVREQLSKSDDSPFFAETQTDPYVLNDVAIIQCFYGIDSSRVDAVNTALKHMLKSQPSPAEWIFVEAQLDESNASFSWLKDKGIIYKFVKLYDASNAYIKGQLWNIGAQMSVAKKLLFIDADVMFCNSSWLKSASTALDFNDVISVHKQSYVANQTTESDDPRFELVESIGSCVAMNSGAKGYPGFTIGMTREYYKSWFIKFDLCSTPYDDVLYWGKILGRPLTDEYPYKGKLRFEKCKSDVKLGSTDEICCHISHGPRKRNDTTEIRRLNSWISSPFSEFEVMPDDNGIVPLKVAYIQYCAGIPTAHETSTSSTSTHRTDSLECLADCIPTDCPTTCDISLIQCFYGNDINSIIATTTAIKSALHSSLIPSDWIFVEAQTSKSNAVFGWLKEYKIKYQFIKLTKSNDGLPIKHALWNIGSKHAKTDKLVFADSDIKFSQDAFCKISDALDQFDVISPWKTISVNDGNISSFGKIAFDSNEADLSGFGDLGIAFTESAFSKHFKEFNLRFDDEHDDWHKITSEEGGLPLTVGFADCTAIALGNHITLDVHKRDVICEIRNRFADAVVVAKSGLSEWNSMCNDSLLVKNSITLVQITPDDELDSDVNMAANVAVVNSVEKTFGEVTDDHPLIVFCGYKPNFRMKSIEVIYEKKTQLEMSCQVPFTFVCFTDDPGNADELGIDVIPFSSKEVRDDPKRWRNEIKRKDVKYPKNSFLEIIQI